MLLGLGIIVQLLALTTDPHRVYIVNNARPDALFYGDSLYYHLPTSHLFARPFEIWDVLRVTPGRRRHRRPRRRPTPCRGRTTN
jgi:hypothetical protein